MGNRSWRSCKFSELCDISRGASPRPIQEFISSEGMPWIKIADATASGSRFITHTNEKIKLEGVSKSVRVYPGDLILSNSATPGLPRFVDIEACIHDGWMLLRNLRGLNKNFAYWLLLYERRNLVQQGNGSVFTNLKTDILKNHDVLIPSLEEQQAIAWVLDCLSEKIELNRKQNHTLEAIAQALFKHWFVDFEFPDENGRPYKSSGGAMQPSEQGEIPVGWRTGQFGDVAKNIKISADPTSIDPATPYVGLEHIDRKSIGLATSGNAAEATSNKSKYGQGDILFGKLRPYFHKVAVAPSTGICSTDILVLNTKSVEFYSVVVWQAFSEGFVEYSNNASTGTRMPRANWKHMAEYSMPLPPKELGSKFNSVAQPLLDKIVLNLEENRTLAELRDTLLPKLMSGELRVA